MDRERERETERERDGETDRQTDRQTERQTETDGETDRERWRDKWRQTKKERCTKTERYIGIDAKRHSWKHGVRDPYKCSSVDQRELAET